MNCKCAVAERLSVRAQIYFSGMGWISLRWGWMAGQNCKMQIKKENKSKRKEKNWKICRRIYRKINYEKAALDRESTNQSGIIWGEERRNWIRMDPRRLIGGEAAKSWLDFLNRTWGNLGWRNWQVAKKKERNYHIYIYYYLNCKIVSQWNQTTWALTISTELILEHIKPIVWLGGYCDKNKMNRNSRSWCHPNIMHSWC